MTNRHYHSILEYFRGIIKGSKWEGHLYAVGGCVRDEVLGAEIHDIDIAVDLPNGGILFTRWLQRRRQLYGAPIFFHKFGTAKLRLRRFPDDEIELVQTRAERYSDKTTRNPEVVSGSIEEDCYRRDFTVNTLYRNITTGEILDLTGHAVEDIREGILRTPMDPYETFDDDPVRILRCLRFAARFDWKIEEKTKEALESCVMRLAIVSRERWSAEFKKMLFGRNLRKSLGTLAKIGGFRYMNTLMRDMSQMRPYGGDKSVLEMGIEDAARLEEAGVDDPAQRLAALYGYAGMIHHEVRDKHGVLRYSNHEITGAAMASKYFKRLGIDRAIADKAVSIIRERGEKRRKAERMQKIEEHLARQQKEHEARVRRRKERARERYELGRIKREEAFRLRQEKRQKRQAAQHESSLPESQDLPTSPQA